MKKVGEVEDAINYFDSKKNKNLYFLIKNRYEWMNKFIEENDNGIEVGAGAGLIKKFIFISFLARQIFKYEDYFLCKSDKILHIIQTGKYRFN